MSRAGLAVRWVGLLTALAAAFVAAAMWNAAAAARSAGVDQARRVDQQAVAVALSRLEQDRRVRPGDTAATLASLLAATGTGEAPVRVFGPDGRLTAWADATGLAHRDGGVPAAVAVVSADDVDRAAHGSPVHHLADSGRGRTVTWVLPATEPGGHGSRGVAGSVQAVAITSPLGSAAGPTGRLLAAAAVAYAVTLLLGVLAVARLGARPTPTAHSTGAPDPGYAATAAAGTGTEVAAVSADGVRSQRRALIDDYIELRDLLASQGLRERIDRTLHAVGVDSVRCEHEPFDPSRHEAVDRVDATDPRQHNRIATTERPGYLDHGELLRRPQVTVYRMPTDD